MPCSHLNELYSLCQKHDLKLSSSDLIRIVCPECGEAEVCPSTLTVEYDQRQQGPDAPAEAESKPQS